MRRPDYLRHRRRRADEERINDMAKMDLKQIFAQRIAAGLKRQSVTTPSRWAEQYRVMGGSFPGPWTFRPYPWLREMHDCKAEMVIGMKGAQLGFTEFCLNIVFYKMDIEGISCLYLMPSKTPDAAEFSSSRFDVALELSPHLQNMFVDVKNVSLKRAGKSSLFIRGTQSKAGLRSLPVGCIILDERSAMNQENVPLALQRVKGQLDYQVFQISTPTTADENIDWEYKRSSQGHFYFRCPHCSQWTTLIYPDCLVVTATEPTDPRIKESHYICKECKGVLDHETKADWLEDSQWVHDFPDRDIKGYHINQLFSPTVKPSTIAQESLSAQSDAVREQEFYNGDLGLTHEPSGGRITDVQIKACIVPRLRNNDPPKNRNKLITMGIDVGSFCHFEIDEWSFPKGYRKDAPEEAHPDVLRQGKVKSFADLDRLISEFGVNAFVIDANPETRSALALCMRFWGIGWMCYYGRGIKDRSINVGADEREPKVTVHRTSWMDLALGRFHKGTIGIPLDANLEYYDHLRAPVRLPKRDPDGNPTASYENGSKADHHAHSRTYAEIAMVLAMDQDVNRDITGKVL
jgi:hypothetical protein